MSSFETLKINQQYCETLLLSLSSGSRCPLCKKSDLEMKHDAFGDTIYCSDCDNMFRIKIVIMD